MRNPKRPFIRSILMAGVAAAALAAGALRPSTAHADEVIYLNGPVPEFGGNVIAPNGSPMAYFSYSQFGSNYFNGTVADAPVSPQGGNYILASVGAPNTWGGTGIAYLTSTANGAPQQPKNLSAYAGGTLEFYLKSDRALVVEIQWDNGSGGNVSSTGYNVASTGGAWQKITIPLTAASFGSAVNYSLIKVPFLIRIPAQYGTDSIYRVDDIKWVAGGGPGDPVPGDATFEFYGEQLTYPFLNGSVRPEYFAYTNGAGYTFNLEEVGTTLEGNKRGRMTISASAGVSGGGWGVQFKNGSSVVDQNLSAFAGGALRFLVNSTEDLAVEVQDNARAVALALPSTGGAWQERVVDLQLFVNAGINLSRITAPFVIRRQANPSTSATWYVDHVRWTKALSSISIIPATTWTATGRHRQFTMVGQDSTGDEVVVYGAWSTAGGSGYSVAPGTYSRYTIATIGSGSATIKATVTTSNSGVSTSSPNIPIPTPGTAQDGTFGLLSETLTGAVLGTDAEFGTYFDNTGASITASDELVDYREGTKSTKIVINVPAGKYAGFFIQHGIGQNEGIYRNMADYYDGSIRFWLKAPAALSGKLDMSIRTATVGTELSKVTIGASHGMVYDNAWHAIVVPIAPLAKAVPFAELSKMKVLFNMSVSAAAGSGGTQTFYIDNIRWDTRSPGTLNNIVIKPTGTVSARVRIPKNLKRTFVARGYDAAGVEVDIYPTWTMSGSIGTLSTNVGARTRLDAASTPALGSLRATSGSVFADTYIDVANITFTQSFNVYSDMGSGGQIGVDQSAGSSILLNGSHTINPGAPEGITVMRATYTITGDNAYATWFDYEQSGTRFLNNYADGYLHFWIRTGRDLEISIRSENIDPGSSLAKLKLSDLGVPTDNTWQEVWLALDDFKIQDPRLDFTQMKVFFGVAALKNVIGNQTGQVFDIDDVKWWTADPHVADLTKIYQGIKDKQNVTTGLVVTFSNDSTNRAVTYDQALAAMAFTFHGDTGRAAQVLNVYRNKWVAAGAGFAGFHEEYDRDTVATIRDYDRTAGPNAWIMLAALHYKAATGSTTYDTMITGIANWLLTLQTADGAIRLGYLGNPGTLNNSKSTEHNFDVYAAFRAYKMITALTTYETSANNIFTWLTTSHTAGVNPGAWNAAQGRFNVGRDSSGVANTDYALDCYSWAPLALTHPTVNIAPYHAVVNLVGTTFGTTKLIDVNGFSITGFDFSRQPGNGTSIPYGQPVDKDAVWIEGTAHMALAYLAVGDQARATQYLNELDKAVYTVSPTAQALNYASNAGTAYWTGSLMDSTHAALSSMCWYLFAKRGFNPLQPVPLFGVTVKNISNNLPAASVTWSVSVPNRWAMANQYVQISAQPVDLRPWGVAIYTDNKNAALTPRFVDPTPAVSYNFDSNPAGLLEALPGWTTTHYRLDMGWKIQDSTSPVPSALQPYSSLDGSGSFEWLFMKDRGSPAMDVNGDGDTNDVVDRPAFTPGESYITVKSNAGIQAAGGGFFPTLSPDYIYLEGDFTTAAAQVTYKANVILEYFIQ